MNEQELWNIAYHSNDPDIVARRREILQLVKTLDKLGYFEKLKAKLAEQNKPRRTNKKQDEENK